MSPYYYKPKGSNNCMTPCAPEAEECPNHPDLCLLRDAAADERDAIARYMECAINTCLDEVFLDVAEDEMQHFMKTMRLISCLDPIQAKRLEEAGLDFLTMRRRYLSNGSCCHKKEAQDVLVEPPDKEDLPAICCLTEAIKGELHAINKYQRYMNQAQNEKVKKHFCMLMNEEKEHVAEFTSALFKITHEPLPEEKD